MTDSNPTPENLSNIRDFKPKAPKSESAQELAQERVLRCSASGSNL